MEITKILKSFNFPCFPFLRSTFNPFHFYRQPLLIKRKSNESSLQMSNVAFNFTTCRTIFISAIIRLIFHHHFPSLPLAKPILLFHRKFNIYLKILYPRFLSSGTVRYGTVRKMRQEWRIKKFLSYHEMPSLLAFSYLRRENGEPAVNMEIVRAGK